VATLDEFCRDWDTFCPDIKDTDVRGEGLEQRMAGVFLDFVSPLLTQPGKRYNYYR
jgi:hypothetical protein